MTTLYLIRHAESTANAAHILASQQNFPLSERGKADAQGLAQSFAESRQIDRIWCSPLLRAQQTAAPFLLACNAPLCLDERLQEQHLGRFSGMSYAAAEADPAYCQDRTARWAWVPQGGGESYQMIALRVQSFLNDLREQCAREALDSVLLVTHAVTLRLLRACLEATLPHYPENIAANGELWQTRVPAENTAAHIETVMLGQTLRSNRE